VQRFAWLVALAAPFLLNDFLIIWVRSGSLLAYWGADVALSVAAPCLLLWYLDRRHVVPLWEVLRSRLTPANQPPSGLASGHLWSLVLGALVAAWLTAVFAGVVDPVLYWLWPNSYRYSYPLPEVFPMREAVILYVSLRAAVLEEVIFRGVFITALTRAAVPRWAAIAVSVSAFGCIHWYQGPAGIVAAAVWAIPLAYWYARWRDLLGIVSCHLFYNLLFHALRAAS